MPAEKSPDLEHYRDGVTPLRSTESKGKNIDDNADYFPPKVDNVTEPALSDLEQVQQIPSGPVYSIFSKHQKRFIVSMVSLGSFFSPLSANIYFPVLNALARDLKVSNELINLTLTSYMIFQGLAPTFFGDLGDMTGRRPAYIIGFIIYIGANIGLALQNQYAALFLLRCLQSTGSSGHCGIG